MEENNEMIGYLKFFGPSVDDGKIDAKKAGKALIALQNAFEIFQEEERKKSKAKKDENQKLVLRLGGVRKNCTEILYMIEPLLKGAEWLACALTANKILKEIGVYEFPKAWFKTMGEQMALKKFAKGEAVREKEKKVIENNVVVVLENSQKETKEFSQEALNYQKLLEEQIYELAQLEENSAEKLEIGFYEPKTKQSVKVEETTFKETDFFKYQKQKTLEEKIAEDFDEKKAERIDRIIGQFTDYFDLASKYHFAFQPRKNTSRFGKNRILCIVPKKYIGMIFDEFKKEKKDRNNLVIGGIINKDEDGNIDKIKIEWISDNENFDPQQDFLC